MPRSGPGPRAPALPLPPSYIPPSTPPAARSYHTLNVTNPKYPSRSQLRMHLTNKKLDALVSGGRLPGPAYAASAPVLLRNMWQQALQRPWLPPNPPCAARAAPRCA